MKNYVFVLFFLAFCSSLKSQEFIEFTSTETIHPTYNVLVSEDTVVEFELQTPGMFVSEEDSFQRIKIEGHFKLDSAGFPEIPVVSFLFAIPECDHVNLSLEVIDSVRLKDMFIYPAPEMVLDTSENGIISYKEEFIYNESVYNTDDYFPGIIAETINKGAVRDQHCIKVLIYPIQFNPVAGELVAYSKLKIQLTFDNPEGSVNNNVGIFNEILGNSMVNYISNGLNASVSCAAGLNNFCKI